MRLGLSDAASQAVVCLQEQEPDIATVKAGEALGFEKAIDMLERDK